MLSAIGLLSPASSWNWLANLCSAARLASSRIILSWSFSVIEGTPPVVDDKRGDPRLSHFRPLRGQFSLTFQAMPAGPVTAARGPLAGQLERPRAQGHHGRLGRRSGGPQGLRNMDCILMARPMSPLIL